jgi:hypothetical protein
LVEKKKGQGVLGKKPFFFLPLESEQREEGRAERRPARGRGAPAVPPMAVAGKWLKMERRPRGIDPRAHLVLEWSEGAAPREGGGSAAVLKGRRRCRARGRG